MFQVRLLPKLWTKDIVLTLCFPESGLNVVENTAQTIGNYYLSIHINAIVSLKKKKLLYS